MKNLTLTSVISSIPDKHKEKYQHAMEKNVMYDMKEYFEANKGCIRTKRRINLLKECKKIESMFTLNDETRNPKKNKNKTNMNM